MTTVTIAGWKAGLSKVELNHLLREHAGYGLADAKHAVDRVLAGALVSIELPDPESAAVFRQSAEAIGAVFQVATEAQEIA